MHLGREELRKRQPRRFVTVDPNCTFPIEIRLDFPSPRPMSERTVLDTLRLPARLDIRQTAMLLGVQVDEIQILMRAKLLKPLGEPAQNGHKYFSSSEIEALGKDRIWLDKASKTITRHWRSKRGTLEGTRENARVATRRDGAGTLRSQLKSL